MVLGVRVDDLGVERRRLSERERDLAIALLRHRPFAGRDELLAQVDAAWVTEGCECGCATVSLEIDASSPSSSFSGVVPAEAELIADDPACAGGVFLMAHGGRLSLLEIWWIEAPIAEMPRLTDVRIEGETPLPLPLPPRSLDR